MNGDEIARFDQIDDELQLLLAGVAADVNRRCGAVFVDDMRFPPEQVIDHPVNRFFVARDDAAGKDDRVSLLDLGVLVIVDGGARERRHGLALRAADQHANLFRGEILDLAGIDHQAFGNFDVSQILGNLGGVGHGAANEGDLASVLLCQLDREIDAVDGRRETGDKEATLGVGENFVELAAYGALAGGVSATLHIGRILKQRQHAFLAVLGEGMEIEKLVVGRRGIDFEVPGMDDYAQRTVNGQGDAVDQAVRHLDGMNGEGSDLDSLVGAELAKIGIIEQTVFVEFVFHIGQREFCTPDRHVELREDPGKSPDVVFMAVRENDGPNALAIFDQVGNVRDHDIDPEQLGFGEHESGVDDDNVISPAHSHAIHTEFAQSAEWDDLQFTGGHLRFVKMMLAQRVGLRREGVGDDGYCPVPGLRLRAPSL